MFEGLISIGLNSSDHTEEIVRKAQLSLDIDDLH
jgi:hypothetical protein